MDETAQADQPLSQLLWQLVEAETWRASRKLIEQYPQLLSDAAVQSLAQAVQDALQAGDIELVYALDEHRALLQRCQEVGPAAAFAEKRAADDAPDELREQLERVLAADEAYQHTTGRAALEQLLADWQNIIKHPAFAAAGLRLRSGILNKYASKLIAWYQLTGNLSALQLARQSLQTALDFRPFISPDRVERLNNLGAVLYELHSATGQLDYLDEALEYWQQAASVTPMGTSEWSSRMSNYGAGLYERYGRSGNPADLEAAIDVWRKAVTAAAPNDARRVNWLNNLGVGIHERYKRTGAVADLEDAIVYWTQAVDLTPPASPDRTKRLGNLANGLRDRYLHTGNLQDLQTALQHYRVAIALAPDGSPLACSLWSRLGNALRQWYDHSGDQQALDEAITAFQTAIEHTPQSSPDWSIYSTNLAHGLRDRYVLQGKSADLEAALVIYQRVLQTAALTTELRSVALTGYGAALRDRYALAGNAADLDSAANLLEQAIGLLPPGAPLRATHLNNLAATLRNRYEHSGQKDDLERAVQLLQEAVDVTPRNSPDRASRLNNLGAMLHYQYEQEGDLDHLTRALISWQEAVNVTPLTAPDRAGHLSNLAYGLHERYQRSGDLNDLETAIIYWQQAAQISTNVSEQALHLSSLGLGLHSRYLHTGHSVDLDRSVEMKRQAIQITPPDSADLPRYLTSLGVSLTECYSQRGNLSDLDEAIAMFQQALALTPVTSPERAVRLNNLGNSWHDRYERTHEAADLDRALAAHRAALEQTSAASPNRAGRLNNLGNCLRDHYVLTSEKSDLDEALAVYEEALRLAPADSPGRPAILIGWGHTRRQRYQLLREPSDLDLAVTAYRQALSAMPSDSPQRSQCYTSLGEALRDVFEHTLAPTTLTEAIDCYRSACSQGLDRALENALPASQRWGQWALQRAAWAEAAEALEYGLQTIRRLFGTQLTRANRALWLSEAQSLPTMAAYAHARSNNLDLAVASLELGRAQLLTEALERERVSLEQLKSSGHEILHTRYRAALERIAHIEHVAPDQSPSPAASLIAQLRTARDELDEVIAQIQQVTGYEDFFREPTFEQIQRNLRFVDQSTQAAVYVLTIPVGGVALIVQQKSVNTVWLAVRSRDVSDWLIKRDNDHVTGGFLPAQLEETSLKVSLRETLPALGASIMQPVAEALKLLDVSDVALIPCGRLALFPLHAAEYQVDGRTYRFMDEFTVTYTPSARALGSCQDTLAAMAEQSPTLVGVGNPLPLPEGANPLTYAQPEVEEIARLFGEATTPLYEQQATREALDAQLGKTAYLHLSCHGTFNAQDPLQSGVVLANGEMLTVRDLIGGQRLRGTRLVVLSACQTAITDFKDLPEEAIGLPGGFVQAGVPGVVGTLWPVNDLSTMLLMVKFYEAHLKDGLAPAAALRQAQLWLRDVTNAELSELFAQYRLTATDRPTATRMAYEMASEKFREYTLRDPNERPYAHPYFWAPFVFYGM